MSYNTQDQIIQSSTKEYSHKGKGIMRLILVWYCLSLN